MWHVFPALACSQENQDRRLRLLLRQQEAGKLVYYSVCPLPLVFYSPTAYLILLHLTFSFQGSAPKVPPSPAVAAPVAAPLSDPSERERLAEEYGFAQIGEPLPDNITLKQVIDTIPPEVS